MISALRAKIHSVRIVCLPFFRVMCLQDLAPCHDVFSNIYVIPMVAGLITEAERIDTAHHHHPESPCFRDPCNVNNAAVAIIF